MARPTPTHQVIFDLDDTLYCELDFVRSGFRAAGDWLAGLHGVNGFEDLCLDLFTAGQRLCIFDEALTRLAIPFDKALIEALVDVYRKHNPHIALAPDAERYLGGGHGPHAIITDGTAITQGAKVAALGLTRWVDLIIFTDDWGRAFWKPHERAFARVEEWSAPHCGRLVYVADNPTKDFVTPKRRGWLTVEIRRPNRVHHVAAPDDQHRAHGVIESLDELDQFLDTDSRTVGRASSGVTSALPRHAQHALDARLL